MDQPYEHPVSAARTSRLLGCATERVVHLAESRRMSTTQKLSWCGVVGPVFLATFVGILWLELAPLVGNPVTDGATLPDFSAQTQDGADPSLPDAQSALGQRQDGADAQVAPTF